MTQTQQAPAQISYKGSQSPYKAETRSSLLPFLRVAKVVSHLTRLKRENFHPASRRPDAELVSYVIRLKRHLQPAFER